MAQKSQADLPGCFRVIVDIFQIVGAVAGVLSLIVSIIVFFFALRHPERVEPIIYAVAGITPSPVSIPPTPTSKPLTPTDTPIPTSSPSPIPTNTPVATATFVPTTTPHPTATPIPILFEDNFDKGLSEQWNIVYGNPLIVNEKLTADEETWIVVGDSSWTDYIVEFDMINSAAAWYNAGNNVLAVRVQDLDNMIAFRWATYESDWFIVESGKWNKIPNAYDNGIKSQSNLRIVVEGNLLTAYIGGNKVFSFVNTQFPTGGVALRIKRGAVFDNFVVKAIK